MVTDDYERRLAAAREINLTRFSDGFVQRPTESGERRPNEPRGIPSLQPDDGNEPRPDVILCLDEACGGRSRITADDYLEGAPELVIEIAASSVSVDLHAKKRGYCRAGVREYIVWRTEQKALDWFVLRDGRHVKQSPQNDGTLESGVFPGLHLSVPALLAENLDAVATCLEKGMASEAHHTFVARLAQVG